MSKSTAKHGGYIATSTGKRIWNPYLRQPTIDDACAQEIEQEPEVRPQPIVVLKQSRETLYSKMMQAAPSKRRSKSQGKTGESTKRKKKSRKNAARKDTDAASTSPVDDELSALGGLGRKPSWQPLTLGYINDVRNRITESCGFRERGKHEHFGEWPDFALDVLVSFPDPLASAQTTTKRDLVDPSYFSRPGILFWGPELRWPGLYPKGRPNCPWHRTWECVQHDGWTKYPRRCMEKNKNTALVTRKHHCTIRKAEGIHPYNFLGTADEVIAQAPAYVQAYWNEHGYVLSHRGAVSRSLVYEMRSLLAHGAGASGFSKTVKELYKTHYYTSRKMWHSFSDLRYHEPSVLRLSCEHAG